MATHDSLQNFLIERPGRHKSDAVDFGGDWSDEMGHRFYLAYLLNTQELFAVAISQTSTAATPAGRLTFGGSGDTGFVELLGTFPPAEVDARLAGWEEEMSKPNSLAWVRLVTQAEVHG